MTASKQKSLNYIFLIGCFREQPDRIKVEVPRKEFLQRKTKITSKMQKKIRLFDQLDWYRKLNRKAFYKNFGLLGKT